MRICLAGEDHAITAAKQQMKVSLADTLKDGARNPAKLILALMAGHPYRLVSYFYAARLPDPGAVLRSLVDGRPQNLIIDSGLFSFMFGSEQGKLPSTYEAYRDYTLRYIDKVQGWGLDGCTLVESDTHRLLGMDATLRLREEFAPLGSRVMYVWHQPEGLDGLVKLARERDYIGIGLPELRVIASGGKAPIGQSSLVTRMCKDLLKRVHDGCDGKPPRIHLLGCTVQDLMETRLAWSCDSTSWLSGVRFGNGCVWTPVEGLQSAGLRSERFAKFRAMACAAFPKAVEFAEKQSNADYYLNCFACAYAYALYQEWLDANYTHVPMRGDDLPGGPL